MLQPRLNLLRERLDALLRGEVLERSLFERARGLLGGDGPADSIKALEALDRDLDKVGVHTRADAKLLKALGAQKGRAGALSAGLVDRAEEALDEVEARFRWVERALSSGRLAPGTLTGLEGTFIRLARAVKVADIFSAPEAFDDSEEIFARVGRSGKTAPANPRVAIAGLWAERAKANVTDVAQKRRDLDAAHELLLRADSGGDRDAVRKLRTEVADGRQRARSEPAVRSLHEMIRQLRATARRDPGASYRSMRGLYERAVEAGEAELSRIARGALASMLPDSRTLTSLIERVELDEAQLESMPAGEKVRSPQPPTASVDHELTAVAFGLDDARLTQFELAAGCARYFDVEDVLAEEVVQANLGATRPVQRRVPYPTQSMTYEFTGSLDEVHNFVIAHPRMLLYDLASNRQVVRAYLDDEPPPRSQKIRKTSVRVYVCDSSGSMHGARARFRDAIVIAELHNICVKASKGLPFDPLYFTFFSDIPTELTRVDSAAEASRQIEKMFKRSPAEGQTDITLAAVSAFVSIRTAMGRDPYLARATVVLITDGEDAVDLDEVRKARAPVGGVDIALSFIALGEENPDLKRLVAEQRALGKRAFYQFLSDPEIETARTEFDSPWRTLLPRDLPATAANLEALLPHLEALEAVARREPARLPVKNDGAFEALFPEKPAAGSGSRDEPGDEAKLTDILDALAEAAALTPVDERASESVVLLNHLLGVYGWSMPRYLSTLGKSEVTRNAVASVRRICRPVD